MAKIPVVPFGGSGGIVCGTYTGDNASSQSILLGFRPKAVLVFRSDGQVSATGWNVSQWNRCGGLALDGNPCAIESQNIVETTDTGFLVFSHGSTPVVSTNEAKSTYYYIAFR